MSTPVVTDSMRQWAEAFVFACQDHAAANDYPFDAEAATRAIREALLNPRWGDEPLPDDLVPEDVPNVPGYLQGRDLP